MRFRDLILPISLAVSFFGAEGLRAEVAWDRLLERIRSEFPNVPSIGILELRATRSADTLLVDVREPEEVAVSRLPGARATQRIEDVRAWLAHGKYQRVVVYCSVGYRSARFASALQRAGVANVLNLEGSIFAWVNAGHPVENALGPTTLVHPYDANWSRYLRPEHRAPLR